MSLYYDKHVYNLCGDPTGIWLKSPNYWSRYQSSIVQNGLGAHLGFEW